MHEYYGGLLHPHGFLSTLLCMNVQAGVPLRLFSDFSNGFIGLIFDLIQSLPTFHAFILVFSFLTSQISHSRHFMAKRAPTPVYSDDLVKSLWPTLLSVRSRCTHLHLFHICICSVSFPPTLAGSSGSPALLLHVVAVGTTSLLPGEQV